MKQQNLPRGSVPRLTLRSEFEAALKNYELSAKAQAILRETPFVVMYGPTSAGRNTLIREMVKTGEYHFIVSDTTRPPRQNDGVWEEHGREYFFRDEAEMLEDIRGGMFIEAEVIHEQQVSGVSIREVQAAHQQGKIAVADVDMLGALNIARLKPDAVIVYLVPPSFEEWLKRIRGRTPVTDEELRNRLQSNLKGFTLVLEHEDVFTFVVNVDKHQTLPIVERLVKTGQHSSDAEAAARAVVHKLAAETEAFLKKL